MIANNPPPINPSSNQMNHNPPLTESQHRIAQLASTLSSFASSTQNGGRCCDQLSRRSRHLDSLTSPASDASAKLTQASENLAITLSLMKDAREKFDTVSDCEPAILRLMQGAREAIELRKRDSNKSNAKNHRTTGGSGASVGGASISVKSGGAGTVSSSNDPKRRGSLIAAPFMPEHKKSNNSRSVGSKHKSNKDSDEFNLNTGMLSEQDVYAAADSMEILRDAYDYFLKRTKWKSSKTALGSLERVHQNGVDAMCLFMTSQLTAAGPAVRMKRLNLYGGGGENGMVNHQKEKAHDTRKRLTDALQNRDLMKSVGEYEEFLPLDTRPVRELRAIVECLSIGEYGCYLGPPSRRPKPNMTDMGGAKIVRTEKVGSGSYSNLTKKPLKTGYAHLDAYGEARKAIAFASIDGYYRHLKSEQKSSVAKRRGSMSTGPVRTIEGSDVDAAARDSVRCLEHAMVIVAGEKSVFRCVISPTSAHNYDESKVTTEYKTALLRGYSHVVSGIVDRTMDIIELVFFKEAGIGHSSQSSSSSNVAGQGSSGGTGGSGANATTTSSSQPRSLGVRAAASAAAAGLRILDGVRILGPSLAKLCDLSESRSAENKALGGVGAAGGGAEGTAAGSLCISIHRTTVKNCARTLENLAKAIQNDPLDGERFRPPDGRVCPVSSDVVRAIRIISPFVSAYKSVAKRRALPWDPSIGEEASGIDDFIKYLVKTLLESLRGKAGNYMLDNDPTAVAKAPLFVMNNTFYLLQQLGSNKQSSMKGFDNEEEELVTFNSPWFKEKVGNVFQAQKESYLTHWEILNKHLTSVDKSDLNYQKDKLLSLESGRLLKARFSGFTEDLERIYTLHKGLNVIDFKLRELLQNDVRRVFFPRYKRFFEKYSRIQFSKKNQDQYLKYPPDRVDAMIGDMYEMF